MFFSRRKQMRGFMSLVDSMFSISGRPVGGAGRTFVIAEIGVNHDGSLRRAKELVALAAACGADAVKLQIFSAAMLMHPSSQFAGYQQQQSSDADPAAMLRRFELPLPAVRELVGFIRRHNLIPLATPFSVGDVDVIEELDLPAVKIASPDVVNRPLLERVAALGRPMIVSTGAATMEEVALACEWARGWACPLALLHCISSYPTPIASANLCWIGELAARFAVPVGYSDHTTHGLAGAMAVMAGASIVEKHLTYDRSAAGPDHAASADPAQMGEYVRAIRMAETMRGTPGKRVLPVEQDVRTVSRQSLVCAADVRAGEMLARHHLIVQRPGTGIPAAQLSAAVGRAAVRAIASGTLLQWDMLADAA
jgi:N,N'-diacetyllegionaminate synthase